MKWASEAGRLRKKDAKKERKIKIREDSENNNNKKTTNKQTKNN